MDDKLTFIHASDSHLGASFAGLATSSTELGESLVKAVSAAFENMIDACIDNQVDFLLLAGDTFNEGEIPFRVFHTLRSGLLRLQETGIEVYICTGNHDPLGSWPQVYRSLPENTHLFASDDISDFVFERDGRRLATIYGISYAQSRVTENLAARMASYRKEHSAGTPFDICMLHTGIMDGAYAPCSIEELRALGADYVALGHIHRREEISKVPPIIYPGSPQGLDINDDAIHGVTLVTLQKGFGGEKQVMTEIPCEVYHWARCNVDVSTATVLEDVVDLVIEALDDIERPSTAMGMVARITLSGRTDLYGNLHEAEDLEQLAIVIRSQRAQLSIDRIINRTSPALDIDALRRNTSIFPATFIACADAAQEDHREMQRVVNEALEGYHLHADVTEMMDDLIDRAMVSVLDELVEGSQDV